MKTLHFLAILLVFSFGMLSAHAMLTNFFAVHNSPNVRLMHENAPSILNLSAQQGIPKHTPTVSFDQNTYKVGDTATITVNDPNLDTDNNLVVTYSSVPPVGTLSNPQDPATDTIGQAGLGTYSDGTPIAILFDIQWGQQDRRWSNSDVPTNKITASCWGGANSNTGTPKRFATGLAASGFFLAETAAGSGVFQGTFEIPDRVCLAPAGTTGGPGVSTVVNGMNIKASYYFRDESGKLVEVSDTAGIRGNCCGLKLVSVSTDKYVYMPGDVVSIKGKSYLNDTDAKISLEKNGKIPVITKDIPINKNGTFYANFTIPFDTTARSWWLTTTVGGGTLSQGIHFKSESIPPLDQFWSGISPNDTLCKPNLTLIFKTTGGSPACVKPDTANILIKRGWAESRTSGISQTSRTNIQNNDPFGITALVIYHPFLGCLSSDCPPNNFYLKINSNATAYLTGYNICDKDSCVRNNTLSVLLPINTILKPNYARIELPENLKWVDGGMVNIQLEVSPNADNRTASLIDLGNSTIVS